MRHDLRLYRDSFAPKGAPVVLPPVKARALYVLEGALAVRSAGGDAITATLSAGAALEAGGGCTVSAGSVAADVLRWELTQSPQEPWVAAADGATGKCLLQAELDLAADGAYLLRCDRVDFPPGGQALTHTHQGGGIRCLLAGSITIRTQGHTQRYLPLQAWFEPGPDPVHASADPAEATAFARVMILPAQLLGGKTSIRYVYPEDLEKPKSQRYQILLDAPLAR